MNYPLYPADPDRDPAELFRNLDDTSATRPVATLAPQPGFDAAIEPETLTTEEVIERQRERFGGVKVGSAFFGWLIAAATFVMLMGIVTVVGVVLGLDVRNPTIFARELPLDLATVGWISAGALLVILFVAAYCGGYVAGRMARFSGVAQGIAVWAWGIAMGVVAVAVGYALGRFDVPAGQAALARVPLPEEALTVAGVVAAVVVAAVTLGGAIAGGVVGVRYHRRVDHVIDDE